MEPADPPDSMHLIEEKIKEQEPIKEILNDVQVPHKKCFLTVEPLMFLTFFGSNLSAILLTNLLLIRSCEYMNLPNCSNIDTHPGEPLDKLVEPYVAQVGMYRLIFESVVPTIIAFFIGPWSDTYGRRPLLILPLIGYCLNFILLIGFAWFKLPPMYVIFTSAPLVFLGGYMTFITGAFCYITDICPKMKLPHRLALAEGALFFGFICGNTLGPFIYGWFPSHGFEGVFAIAFLFCLSALLYAVFFIPESIPNTEHTAQERFRALFDYRQVIDLFQISFGKHDGHSRSTRFIVAGASLLSVMILEGTISVTFLYTRNKFSWDAKEFSFYADASFVIGLIGSIGGIAVFTKCLKMSNEFASCIAFFFKSISYVIAGLGNSSWCMYLSCVVGGLGGMSSPLNRAIMSETVPKNHIGKLFSIMSAFMTAVPIAAGTAYTLLYNSTINSFSGAFFLLSAALSAVCCIALAAITISKQFYNPNPYSLTSEAEDSEPTES